MIMKKGTAKASDVTPWSRDCSELGKVLTVLGTTSHVVLKLVNGPQAFEEGMLPGHRPRSTVRLRVPPWNTHKSLYTVTCEELPDLVAFWNILIKSHHVSRPDFQFTGNSGQKDSDTVRK